MNILINLKIYIAVRKFGRKRSYLAGINKYVHVSRELQCYNDMVYDIDWVLSDARYDISSEEYIPAAHHYLRCCRKDILDILNNIDNEIEKDACNMEKLMVNNKSNNKQERT